MVKRKLSLIFLVILPLLFFYSCKSTLLETKNNDADVVVNEHLVKGKELLKDKDCQGAIKELERAVESDFQNPNAVYWLGAAHYRCDTDYQIMRDYWHTSIELRPDDPAWVSRVRTAIGYTYEIQGDGEKALEEYKIAEGLYPDNSTAKKRIKILNKVKDTNKSREKGKRRIEKLIFSGL